MFASELFLSMGITISKTTNNTHKHSTLTCLIVEFQLVNQPSKLIIFILFISEKNLGFFYNGFALVL